MATNWGQFYSQGGAYSEASRVQEKKKRRKKTYTVKRNDNLWQIAKNYGVSPASILKKNKIKRVRPGQTLNIYQDLETPEDNKFNTFQAEAAQRRQSRTGQRAYGYRRLPRLQWGTPSSDTSSIYNRWGVPSPDTSSIMQDRAAARSHVPQPSMYPNIAWYNLMSPDLWPINMERVQGQIDRGELPPFITAFAADRLGLDYNLLAEWYDTDKYGNLLRKTPGEEQPVGGKMASGGGYGGGGYRRGGGGGGGGRTPTPGFTGFGGTPAAGYSGFPGANQYAYRGVSPTGRNIRGATGLINWRI